MKFIAAICLFFASVAVACADNPARLPISDVDYSFFTTTGIVGSAVPDDSNFSVSSGSVSVRHVYVSSPGVNSELRLNDNYLSGAASNQIGVPLITNTRDMIWINDQTQRGLIITSTCTNCTSGWTQPSFNINYLRVK